MTQNNVIILHFRGSAL